MHASKRNTAHWRASSVLLYSFSLICSTDTRIGQALVPVPFARANTFRRFHSMNLLCKLQCAVIYGYGMWAVANRAGARLVYSIVA